MDKCCEVRRKLARNYAATARLYAEAVAQDVPREQHERLCSAVLRAKSRAEQANAEFEQHVESHRCSRRGIDVDHTRGALRQQ
jgi:hypothetical protein